MRACKLSCKRKPSNIAKAIAELEAAGRAEETASARFDLEMIESFLPSRLSEDELRQIVRRAIDETGASSMREMGEIMRAVMPQVRGRADGKQVNSLVKEILS